MKLQVAYLIAILACAKGQIEEKEINQKRRFLADRAVTTSELATHATYAAGLWTSLGGIVYDVTSFVHPGGTNAILTVGGKAGDTLYMKAFNNGLHPYTIAQVVSRTGIVRIGPLQNGPAPTKPPTRAPTKPPTLATTTKPPTPAPVKMPTVATTTKPPTPAPVKTPTLATTTKPPTPAPVKTPTVATTTKPPTPAPVKMPTLATTTKPPALVTANKPLMRRPSKRPRKHATKARTHDKERNSSDRD